MGTKEPIRFLKMKFAASILAASAFADTRYFSTDSYSPDVDDWWYLYPNIPANQMKKMRETTPVFFDAYFNEKAAGRFSANWADLQDDMESAAADCTFTSRKRRNAGSDERFMNQFVADNFAADDAKSDFWAFQEGHARWIVKQIQEDCPNKAARLLRRVDIFRFGMNWRYCKSFEGLPESLTKETQDLDPVGFCWWSFFNWKGEEKEHPRKSDKRLFDGGIY